MRFQNILHHSVCVVHLYKYPLVALCIFRIYLYLKNSREKLCRMVMYDVTDTHKSKAKMLNVVQIVRHRV